MAGTISDKLQYLQGTKEAIKQAILDKNVQVTTSDTFRSYAGKIAALETMKIVTGSLSFSETQTRATITGLSFTPHTVIFYAAQKRKCTSRQLYFLVKLQGSNTLYYAGAGSSTDGYLEIYDDSANSKVQISTNQVIINCSGLTMGAYSSCNLIDNYQYLLLG